MQLHTLIEKITLYAHTLISPLSPADQATLQQYLNTLAAHPLDETTLTPCLIWLQTHPDLSSMLGLTPQDPALMVAEARLALTPADHLQAVEKAKAEEERQAKLIKLINTMRQCAEAINAALTPPQPQTPS